jgi:LCP family protein required for cell wall assembly
VLILLLVFMISLVWAGMYVYGRALNVPASGTNIITTKQSAPLNNRINILLLGKDDGDGDNLKVAQRSDAMLVASVNPEDKTINLLSIPRDTKVNIPGHKGYEKIAHAYFYGGSTLAVQTVEETLHIPIHYYVAIDWQAFIKIVDILGGVDLYVEQDMDYEDPYANLRIHLTKGYQHLDGQKAGEYVRFRHDELGDIGRVQRQQRLLKALSDDTLHLGTILKLPALANTIQQYVNTDMTLFTMAKLVNGLKGFKTGGLRAEMLPGNFVTIDGLSYWVLEQEQTKKLIERLFNSSDAQISGVVQSGISN